MYDFANSAFAATVLTAVFLTYFAGSVVEGGQIHGIPGESLWLYITSVAMGLVVLTGPALGAIGDASSRRKLFLVVFCLVGSATTCMLVFVTPGRVMLGAVLVVAAAYSFAAGNIFYNSFLPDVASPGRVGRISGLGWALGYLGSGLCLLLDVVLLNRPEWFGIPRENYLPVRVSSCVAGVWWFLFAIPMFLWVKEPRRDRPPGGITILGGFRAVLGTLRHLRDHGTLFLFVVAFLLYSNGVEAVLSAGALFARKELDMSPNRVVLCILMIQGVALAGSLAFGWLADVVGDRRAVLGSLLVWIAVLAWAYFIRSQAEFWVMGAVVGLVMGGTQAASRSLMAVMTPVARKAEFFGFYQLGGRAAATVGPLVCGVVAHRTGSMRAAISSLLVFFAAGALLLLFVNVARGVAEKGRADAART
jgi:UMF1 family MFS transporter